MRRPVFPAPIVTCLDPALILHNPELHPSFIPSLTVILICQALQ